MKKLFKLNNVTITVITFVTIFLLLISGCEQAAEIIQSAQGVTPVASDFTFIGLSAIADGNPITVSIMPKTGKSKGEITVYYEGTSGTVYPKSLNAPSAAGKYTVTFDVEAAEGFNAAKGLKAGTLTINKKAAGGSESEDEDDTDDDYDDEDEEEDYQEDVEYTEEIVEPLSLIDFEDSAWAVGRADLFNNRIIKFKGYDWSISGATKMLANDHYIGSRGIRFRGRTPDDDNNINHLELLSYLNDGIESISFDYASFSSHKNGQIELYYQKEEEKNWVKAGEVFAPEWVKENKMQNVVFNINETGKIRFKIEKVNDKSKTASVNIDNIVITTY
jgi:hypothetical protein